MARFMTGSDVDVEAAHTEEEDLFGTAMPAQQAPSSQPTQRRQARFTRGTRTDSPSAAPRPNRYAGKCAKCGVRVGEGQGLLAGSPGAWGVTHRDGECPDPSQLQEQAQKRVVKIPDGTYTVEWADHYKTIRVEAQDEFENFMPGAQILGFLSGSNNDSDYTSFAHITATGEIRIWRKHQDNKILAEAVKVLSGDPKACAIAQARETGRCWRCHRTLSTPESLDRGLGAECARQAGW